MHVVYVPLPRANRFSIHVVLFFKCICRKYTKLITSHLFYDVNIIVTLLFAYFLIKFGYNRLANIGTPNNSH